MNVITHQHQASFVRVRNHAVFIELTSNQIKSLKEELAKKASMLSKVKEEKASTGPPGKVRFSPAVTEAKEKEELRKTIRRLEERLRDGHVEDVVYLYTYVGA